MEWLNRLLRSLRALFGAGSPTDKMEGVSIFDLERERAGLEVEQEKLARGVQGLEERKDQIFRAIMDEPSQSRKEMLAMQMKQVENDLTATRRQFHGLSMRIEVVQRMIAVKKGMGADRERGWITDTVVRTSPEAVQEWAETKKVDEAVARETLGQIKETLRGDERGFDDPQHDGSIQAILAAAEDVKAARNAEQERPGQPLVEKPAQAPRREMEKE